MRDAGTTWPAPTGAPAGTTGWYLASDLRWYRSDTPPGPGYLLGRDGRWHAPGDAAGVDAAEAWRWSRWGLGDMWWVVLAYVVAGIIGAGIVAGVDVARGGDGAIDDATPLAIGVFVGLNAIGTGGVVWLATRRKGQRSLRRDFGLVGKWLDPLVGLGVGVAGLIAAAGLGAAIDAALDADERTSNVPVDELTGLGDFAVFFVAVAIVTPIVEELVFRGLLYRSLLKRGRSAPTAIAITTVLFVVPHLPAAESWTALLSLFGSIGALGLAFNLACHWTGNRLAAPIVAHMLVNGLATIVLYVT